MDVGSTQTHGFFKHGLKKLDDRRILRPWRQPEQITKFDGNIAKFSRQLLGQPGNLFAAVINPLDHGQ